MTTLVLLGIGMGLGLTAAVAGLQRRRQTPGSVVALLASIGERLTVHLRSSASAPSLRQDLSVLGRSEQSLAVVTALTAIGGAAAPAVACVATGTLGDVPGAAMPLACLASGLVGMVAPSVLLRRSARAARDDVVHSLACWLELVALAQAGGMGIESALGAASSVVGGESFRGIRRVLDHARHAGLSPWDGLERLGSVLGVDELEEVASSIRLAGTEGARIRASLSAKSASLRRRRMAEAQGRANATTERLFLPAVVLMLGFVVFLIYPAGVSLTRVL